MNRNKILIFFIFFNFLLFFYGIYNQVRINFGEQILYSISKPFLLFNFYISNLSNSLKGKIKSDIAIRKEIDKLILENNKLKEKLITFESLKKENKSLKKLLKIEEFFSFEKVTAKVIGGSNAISQSFIIVDKGKNSKLTNGTGVINSNGVVGVVVDTFPSSSKVLLLTDPLFQIDVVLSSNNTHAILTGNNKYCLLKFLPNNNEYKEGEIIITSGLNNIFPYGVPVGYITKIIKKPLYTEAVVKPFIKKYSLDYVVILRKN